MYSLNYSESKQGFKAIIVIEFVSGIKLRALL